MNKILKTLNEKADRATSPAVGQQNEQGYGCDRLEEDDGVGHDVGGSGELVAPEREAGQVVPAAGADPRRGDGGRQANGGQNQSDDNITSVILGAKVVYFFESTKF